MELQESLESRGKLVTKVLHPGSYERPTLECSRSSRPQNNPPKNPPTLDAKPVATGVILSFRPLKGVEKLSTSPTSGKFSRFSRSLDPRPLSNSWVKPPISGTEEMVLPRASSRPWLLLSSMLIIGPWAIETGEDWERATSRMANGTKLPKDFMMIK